MHKLILFLVLFGCSSLDKRPVLSDTAKDVPGWLYSPYEGCSEAQELCATGEAKSFLEADAQARLNLASIFEVQVKSDMTVNSSSSQSSPGLAQVRQDVLHTLKESVNQVLEAVEIKEHYKKDGLSYALASLDRARASEIIRSRLDRVDNELEVYWSRKQRTNLRKILRLTLTRENLNERLAIVTGHRKPGPVTYKEVMAWKDSRPKSGSINLKVGQAPEWLVEKLRELLTEAGFTIVRGEAAHVLTLNVDSIREFLNVSGFEKYTFTFTLQNNEGDDRKKVITTSETVTGRSQADALLKVRHYFLEYLETHLSDLHLD